MAERLRTTPHKHNPGESNSDMMHTQVKVQITHRGRSGRVKTGNVKWDLFLDTRQEVDAWIKSHYGGRKDVKILSVTEASE
jgi:hypothetical protein